MDNYLDKNVALAILAIKEALNEMISQGISDIKFIKVLTEAVSNTYHISEEFTLDLIEATLEII